ncbi:MAG TPA: STAS domain-containing protein [Gaiellaceae bacterium]|nr:STAS domain-containing protein [Gaiellaceae bacterium]
MSGGVVAHAAAGARATGPAEAAGLGAAGHVLVAEVSARGVVDAGHAASLARELAAALSAGATRLLVDLREAHEVTTAGMNALLAARAGLVGRGEMAVVLQPSLRRRFEVLQLASRFSLASTRAEAARLLGIPEDPPEAATPPRAHAA